MRIYIQQTNNFNNTSFCANSMKKSQFSGIDRFVVEKYKLPIEKFHDISSFQDYCGKLISELESHKFKGRSSIAETQRQSILDKWYKYLSEKTTKYTNSIALLILKGITHNLKINSDNLPPLLVPTVLDCTLREVNYALNTDPYLNFDFGQKYSTNLCKSVVKNSPETHFMHTGWIIIPSRQHDIAHYEDNVEKLKILSAPMWCTKNCRASLYLDEGDMHIYLEKGEPVIGIRFVNDKIEEIQGPLNDLQIPLKYADIIAGHVKDYKLWPKAYSEVVNMEFKKRRVDVLIHKLFPDGIKNYSSKEILEVFGMKCLVDPDGKFILSEYKRPPNDISYAEFGINEAELVKNIKIINGNADFSKLEAANLDNIEEVKGNCNLSYSSVNSMRKLKRTGGSLYANHTRIPVFESLEEIGENACLQHSEITDLFKLKKIGRHGKFNNSKLSSTGDLQEVGGNVYIADLNLSKTDFENIKIGGEIIDWE